ncbi:MAG: hypothetical protein ACI9ZF_002499 [Bradyrhizobium sp.]|jgi:hypothetical protein
MDHTVDLPLFRLQIVPQATLEHTFAWALRWINDGCGDSAKRRQAESADGQSAPLIQHKTIGAKENSREKQSGEAIARSYSCRFRAVGKIPSSSSTHQYLFGGRAQRTASYTLHLSADIRHQETGQQQKKESARESPSACP